MIGPEDIYFDPLDHVETVTPSSGWVYRDYQDECCACVETGWAQFRTQLIVLATGTGKTVIFTRLTQKEVDRGGCVLILAHTEELLDQAADKLNRSTGLEAAKEKAQHHATLHDNIVVASVQTLARDDRLQGWPPDHFSLIIVDEAHRTLAKSYLKILQHFKGRVLGVTATADRGDKKNLAAFYEHMPFQFDLLKAVHAGWLVRPRVHEIPLKIDIKGVRVTRTSAGADLDLTEVSHRIAPFLHEIARHIVAQTKDRKQGIIFLPSIETAAMMSDSLRVHGMSANYVSGECDDRSEKIAAFKSGRTQALCNAMLLIEGFDHDAIDWLSMLRPTKIRSLYAQSVGRGTRPLTEIVAMLNSLTSPEKRQQLIAASAKPDLKILDFLWLTDSLDLVSPYQLVAANAAVAEKMRNSTVLMQGDLIDMASQAERDLLASLETAVAKNEKKKGRVIDPIELAVRLHDDEIAHYEPSSRWEFQPPSTDQMKILQELGIDAKKIRNAGLAFRIIQKAKVREQNGLCTFRQMNFFEKLGHRDVAFWSKEKATALQRSTIARWKKEK